jgi:hypothetical protein
MSKKYVEDIRRIAKTDEILKKLPHITPDKDKASILSNRGVGNPEAAFDPCQYLYSTDDGSYSCADIIDGNGPKVQDGTNNHCSVLNTITSMREIDVSPTLLMTLKPDGVFLPPSTSGYLYTSNRAIGYYESYPELFDPINKWAFTTPEEVYDLVITKMAELQGSSPVPQELISTTFATLEDGIGSVNFSTSYPIYFAIYSLASDLSDTQPFNDVIFGLPFNYDYSIDSMSTGGDPDFLACPTAVYAQIPPEEPVETFDLNTIGLFPDSKLMYIPYDAFNEWEQPNALASTGLTSTNSFQLAIDVGSTNLWKPNPDETTAPLKYYDGVSIVNFEFGTSYARTGTIRPAKDGGFVLYETDGGDPIGSCYVFRQNRTLATVINATQLNSFLP